MKIILPYLLLSVAWCSVAPCPISRHMPCLPCHPSQPKRLPFCHRYTAHSITSLSAGANTPSAFPHRARWRCVSVPECKLAGPLSPVSSVTLCSHSIRAPCLRGAADKILIILAHRIKGTRTERRGGGRTHIYKHTYSLNNANLTERSTVQAVISLPQPNAHTHALNSDV